jgi:pimeloyl-ACP methyl ester carboxylesterase
MKFHENPLFHEFAGRAISRIYYGGADLGECFAALELSKNGSDEVWFESWHKMAARLEAVGDDCLSKNHLVSAKEAYLRAVTYYQIAYFPLFGSPIDPRLIETFEKESGAFKKAASLFDPPIEILEIPFESSTLPAYFVRVDATCRPRPTLIHTNGYDSNIQEMFFHHAPAATRRGYNCLLFDGPGQGRNLIRDNLFMRSDWEKVVAAVIDYALTRREINPAKIVLVGWSFGGFLAPRAAAFERRIAALIADPGLWDLKDIFAETFPLNDKEKNQFPHIADERFQNLEAVIRQEPCFASAKWKLIQRAFWVHQTNCLKDYVFEMMKYEISSVVHQITCPTLVTYAEKDSLALGAPKLFEAIRSKKQLLRFTAAEGSGGHCECMARSLYHQRVFDWLDETLC